MAEVEREEVELELGLSIGGRGSFRKYETSTNPNIGFNLETREISTSPVPVPESDLLDAKTKREIHAMRRQEAKKKRQEKRNRGLRNSNNISPVTENQNQDRDDEQRASKREKININGSQMSNISEALPNQYPYTSFQFVPYTNGYPYPYMMPWWTPNAGSNLTNVVQPMPCRVGFGPDYTGSDKSGEKTGGEDRKTTSYGGSTSSSTVISDSNSSETTNVSESVVETRVDDRKPPKAPVRNRNEGASQLQQMPYVSTKGEGPNGKRVTGFLLRYTKSEVNIVCVCHGTAFSPVEFVEHAGGTDVSNPLKHITVIPFE
ncbi:ninja-family protein 3 [Cannabis sativa]|uniref:ninja-family protein 3 n=1 Tax=Cannabis sativa TaxID=3483 RepID=UPI0029C9D1C2|nr:ninja-family protein 3 [Cannabis sativa]